MSHTSADPFYSAFSASGALNISRSSQNQASINAAGALIWRLKQNQLEVLIIHRPHYDDWSWPKGKQDPGETLPETAVREIREEVGLKITLGAPLAVTSYKVKGKSKEVYYWAAQLPAGAKARADEGEVDQLRWVTPKQAKALLTNATDREPLQALVHLAKAGDLATRSLVLVRHAKAKPRSSWAGAEGERILAATGKRQAHALSRLLTAWQPDRLLSSPWARCMQTVYPYAQAQGLSIKEKRALTEDSYRRDAQKSLKVAEAFCDRGDRSALLCTHRPVLPAVLAALEARAPKALRQALPQQDPFLKPGELLVAQVSLLQGRLVSLEQVKPFED